MAGNCHTDTPDSKANLGSSSMDDLELTDLHIAIVSANKKRLSNKILTKIQDLILFRLKDSLKKKDILVTPRFVTQPVIDGGILKLTCLDDATKLWVEEVVSKLIGTQYKYFKNYIEIPPIKVVHQRDMIKCRILIPNSEYDTFNEILDILNKMNPDAAVEKWIFDENVTKESKSTIVTAYVPSDLVPSINKHLYYGLGRATFEVLEQKVKSDVAAKLDIAKPE